jgi:hypothetical protein
MTNVTTTPEEKTRAKYLRITVKASRKAKKMLKGKGGSPVVSGGLPSLGKRR